MANNALYKRGMMGIKTQLSRGLWPWSEGVRARLPLHFKKQYCDRFMTQPIPVHHRPDPRKFTMDKFGVKIPVVNRPIPVVYPREADDGLWGGEGIVEGLKQDPKHKWKPLVPKIWKPRLMRTVLYSEILDKHLELTVTPRTLDLIDEAYGFDFYILKTHQVDLRSKLGMMLKREMLTAVVEKNFYPDDPEKRDEIYDKYNQFIIPKEEIPWLGLTIVEAEIKQQKAEEDEEANKLPLKYMYFQDLKGKIKSDNISDFIKKEKETYFGKLNPFASKDSKQAD